MIETLIGAVTAASAVIAVAISLYILRLQLREQGESRNALEQQDALRVTCWPDWSPDEIPLLSGQVLRDPVVSVSNRTNEPVFGVFFDYRDQSDGHPVRVEVGTVPPGAVRTVPILLSGAQPTPGWQPSRLLPTLFFRDARNRWWHRNTIGRLEPDPGPSNDDFFASGGTFASVGQN
jgi:hypothetical protein